MSVISPYKTYLDELSAAVNTAQIAKNRIRALLIPDDEKDKQIDEITLRIDEILNKLQINEIFELGQKIENTGT